MFSANRAPILHRNEHCPQIDRNEISHDPHHLGVPSGASETISEAMACLEQTMHLSCTNTKTISKRTKMTFHMTT
jgi:hypothetical protein